MSIIVVIDRRVVIFFGRRRRVPEVRLVKAALVVLALAQVLVLALVPGWLQALPLAPLVLLRRMQATLHPARMWTVYPIGPRGPRLTTPPLSRKQSHK